jgi:dihydrofolate synthase/folylpolyglutamate synthase
VRTLAQWLSFQEQLHPQTIDMTLGRVTLVARRLGVEQPSWPVITVAGTNGKGSTVTHIAALLKAGGARVGLFTSPHFLRYNERIQVDGREVDDAKLVAAFEEIEAKRADVSLTYFEYNTLAALLIFAQAGVEVAVLEVGLGGRLDATNLVAAQVAVVCSVGFDHRDWLGETLEEIGAEKAGIFRAARPAVLGTADMPASVAQTIARLSAQPLVAGTDFTWQVAADGRWRYQGLGLELTDLPPSALAGEIQYRNAATALTAVQALRARACRAAFPHAHPGERGRGAGGGAAAGTLPGAGAGRGGVDSRHRPQRARRRRARRRGPRPRAAHDRAHARRRGGAQGQGCRGGHRTPGAAGESVGAVRAPRPPRRHRQRAPDPDRSCPRQGHAHPERGSRLHDCRGHGRPG